MKNRATLLLSILCIAFNSCNNISNSNLPTTAQDKTTQYAAKAEAHAIEMQERYATYVGDTLLDNKKELIGFYIKKYSNTRWFESIFDAELKADNIDFEKALPLNKSIMANGMADTVFVLLPLSLDDEGDAYYFFNKQLPRLATESYCCHPSNFFVVDDIDEDGICEVGIYFSVCTSRYKSLHLYTLKNGEWLECGVSEFDILTQDPQKVVFSSLVKKTGKNQFKMCNFMEGNTFWENGYMSH